MTFPTRESYKDYKEKDLSGFVHAGSIPMDVWRDELSKPIQHIHGFNIVTDTFKHVPKTIHYRGVRLIADKHGVSMIDNWHNGGMELRFRSLRTAKVFAKGWVYDESR